MKARMLLLLAALPAALLAAEPQVPPTPMPAADQSAAMPAQPASAHVMYDAAQLQWGDAPPALEKGAQVAVLSGDPGKPGPFTIRIKVPAGFKVARHWHPTDERVTVMERTNVRTLTPDVLGGPVGLTVADLSFISLRLVLPALAACTGIDGDLALMVKPQFEVGKERVGSGGVVRDPLLRAEAVLDVAATGAQLGLGVAGVAASPLPGPSGNVEFFLWFRRDAPPADEARVHAVVAAGPSGAVASAGPASTPVSPLMEDS